MACICAYCTYTVHIYYGTAKYAVLSVCLARMNTKEDAGGGASAFGKGGDRTVKICVSSLGFCGPAGFGMANLPSDFGVEIFYEWGGATYWDLVLEKAMKDRQGTFSIHAPFQGGRTEMSLTEDEDALFDYLREPFGLYHKYGAEGYVVHTNGPYLTVPTAQERAERIKRVEERLAKFNDICLSEGVTMLVENLAFGKGKETLCYQEDFLKLFEHNPALNCIVDTGHAVLAGIDMFEVQKALGGRLKAYHIHDNDGSGDGHQPIGTGVIDWQRFGEGARLYTPDATFTMEYNPGPGVDVERYAQDAQTLRRLVTGEA